MRRDISVACKCGRFIYCLASSNLNDYIREKKRREREREILLENISSLKDFERKSYYYFLVTVFLALR